MKDNTTQELTRETAIREHFPMPDDIRRHATTANHDLHFGPYRPDHRQQEEDDTKQPLYSFADSLAIFAEWVRELDTVWYDPDSGMICTTEPTGEWYNEDKDEYSFDYRGESEGWIFIEVEPYWEIDADAIASAWGYATLLTYA